MKIMEKSRSGPIHHTFPHNSGAVLWMTAFVSISLVILPGLSLAQSHGELVVTGSVQRAEDRQPLPGTTIRVVGTTFGTTTNADGRFRILLEPGEYRLSFAFIGFISDTVRVSISSRDTTLDVFLVQSNVSLPEVTVYPQSTNPADDVILRAIAAKEKRGKGLRSYSFDAYTRTVLRVDTGGPGTPSVIGGILETQTKGYWKAPDSYREIITAKRQTANFNSNQNVFTPGQVLNLNDDVLSVGRYAIPGPLSPSAPESYEYEIVDTVWQGSTRIFRIGVSPKESASPLFKGFVDIEDGSFALIHARLGLSDPTALDPLRNLVYDEKFSEYGDGYWLPIMVQTTFSVKFTIPPVPPIDFDNTSVLYDYSINPEIPAGFFSPDVSAQPLPVANTDSSVWNKKQILPLTHEEVLAYARLDSLARNMPFYAKAILFLARLPDEVSSWPLTSVSDFYHFNRVEGSYAGAGFTSSRLLERTSLTAIGGYGFSDRRWKYDLGASYDMPWLGGVTVGGRLFDRLSNRPEEDIYSRFEVTLGALLYRDDYRDYYRSKGWNGYMNLRLNSSWRAGARFNDEYQSSVRKNTNYSIVSQPYEYRDNPRIDDGWMRSVDVSLKLDTRRFTGSGVSLQTYQATSYWVGNVSAEFASPEYLSSSFSFGRYSMSLLRHQMTFASAYLKLWAIGGFAEGALPLQRLFEIQASYGGYAEEQVLSTLSVQRLLSGRTVVAGVEHDFPSTLFRWTGTPVIRNIWFDVTVFVHAAAANKFKPMAEAGFGLVNILPFIRTDFTWGVAGLCRGFAWTLETTLGF